MANPKAITLKLSILLIVMFNARDTISAIFPKVVVTIKNDIAPNPTPLDLTVHCKSKDDDLGFHTIKFREIYMFSFRPNVIPDLNTLFWCSFTWKGSPYRHYLDIYDERWDDCIHCNWKINNTNGGCKVLKEGPNYDQCLHWKSIQLMDANNTSKI